MSPINRGVQNRPGSRLGHPGDSHLPEMMGELEQPHHLPGIRIDVDAADTGAAHALDDDAHV